MKTHATMRFWACSSNTKGHGQFKFLKKICILKKNLVIFFCRQRFVSYFYYWDREKNELQGSNTAEGLVLKDRVSDAIDNDIYYTNALTGGWDWGGEYSWNEYELNGKYTVFTGTLITGFWANEYPDYFKSPKFVFEVDGKIVAEYELQYNDKRLPISLNISGAQRLRIYIFAEYVRDGSASMSSQRMGYLVNADLHK